MNWMFMSGVLCSGHPMRRNLELEAMIVEKRGGRSWAVQGESREIAGALCSTRFDRPGHLIRCP